MADRAHRCRCTCCVGNAPEFGREIRQQGDRIYAGRPGRVEEERHHHRGRHPRAGLGHPRRCRRQACDEQELLRPERTPRLSHCGAVAGSDARAPPARHSRRRLAPHARRRPHARAHSGAGAVPATERRIAAAPHLSDGRAAPPRLNHRGGEPRLSGWLSSERSSRIESHARDDFDTRAPPAAQSSSLTHRWLSSTRRARIETMPCVSIRAFGATRRSGRADLLDDRSGRGLLENPAGRFTGCAGTVGIGWSCGS